MCATNSEVIDKWDELLSVSGGFDLFSNFLPPKAQIFSMISCEFETLQQYWYKFNYVSKKDTCSLYRFKIESLGNSDCGDLVHWGRLDVKA